MTPYEYILSIDNRGAVSGFKSAGEHGGAFYDQMVRKNDMLSHSIKHIGGVLAVTFSVHQILSFAEKSIAAFEHWEGSLTNVRAGLESTRFAAGKTMYDLKKQSDELEKSTIFERSDIMQNVTAQLLTFPSITKDIFDRTQKSVLDVTAKLDGIGAGPERMHQISIMLGKALNDPLLGMRQLTRVGIQFSETQRTQIKHLIEQNKLWNAQDLMLKEIQRQYGGTAEALAGTEAGRIITAQHEINANMIKMGENMIPAKIAWSNFLVDLSSGLSSVIDGLQTIANLKEQVSQNQIEHNISTGNDYINNVAANLKKAGIKNPDKRARDLYFADLDEQINNAKEAIKNLPSAGFIHPYIQTRLSSTPGYLLQRDWGKSQYEILSERIKDLSAEKAGLTKYTPDFGKNNNGGEGENITDKIMENSKPTIVNIRLDKLQDQTVINSQTVEAGAKGAERSVIDMLLRVVNSGNRIANG